MYWTSAQFIVARILIIFVVSTAIRWVRGVTFTIHKIYGGHFWKAFKDELGGQFENPLSFFLLPLIPTYPSVPIYLLWLTAPGQSGNDPVLQPGDYSYPFQFLIPNIKMPTSVEGRYGYVRYWLKGIVDRRWRIDITTKAAFTMLEYVDINTPLLLVSFY